MIVTVSGKVERIITTKIEGFSRIKLASQFDSVIGGNLQALREDDDIIFIGRKEIHPKYGPQTKIIKWWLKKNCPFDSSVGVAANYEYLIDKLKLTPKKAEDIFVAYLTDTIKTIEENPYRIATDGLVSRISVKYIDDHIAPHFLIDRKDHRRLKAAILEALERSRSLYGLPLFEDESGDVYGAVGGGHTYIDMSHLVCHVADAMNTPRKAVREEVIKLATTPRNDINPRPLLAIDKEDGKERYVYRYALHRAEKGLGHHVKHLLANPVYDDDTIASADIVRPENFEMTEEQVAAVRMAMSKRLSIITGGPGVGKTTIIKAITETLKHIGLHDGQDFHLCAFTGVAARRMADATGCQASTIHRLLEYNPSRKVFQLDNGNPLRTRFVICDEASMIAMGLMSCLFDAIPNDARVLLVGDADQLSPIDAGAPFKDLVNWGQIPTARLLKIHRQEQANSLIIQGSRKILDRKFPEFSKDFTKESGADLFVFPYTGDDAAVKNVIDLLTTKIPQNFDIPIENIQIICPLKRQHAAKRRKKKGQEEVEEEPEVRMLSSQYLNEVIQKKLTGSLPVGAKFNKRDRVIHIKNNYDIEVMNGEIGYVEHRADKSAKFPSFEYSVRFGDGRLVAYDHQTAGQELELAYAMTVHKSQGSEFLAVISLAYNWGQFFTKQMLYTAVTRGKRIVALVSPKGGSSMAKILKIDESKRNSRLIWRAENENLSLESLDQISVEELSADDTSTA